MIQVRCDLCGQGLGIWVSVGVGLSTFKLLERGHNAVCPVKQDQLRKDRAAWAAMYPRWARFNNA